jgi:two-component system, chemotaxis family, protein-glutamate methylesterase/glutaminase
MASYRVLVVDDSVFMRRIITDLITENSQFQVIDTAKNGKEAVEKVKLLQPDVVTMDIEMPVMNGLEALKQIMTEQPTPVVMLSSLTLTGTNETIKALEYGAVDFIRKPSGSVSLDLFKVKKQIHEKLLIAVKSSIKQSSSLSQVEQVSKPNLPLAKVSTVISKPVVKPVSKDAASVESGNRNSFKHIVAIGTSTGGPKALNAVLTQIPASFMAPILIVQHMPPNFTKSLANRLNDICQIQVVEAEDRMIVQRGTAYIAPGGWHMELVKDGSHGYRIALSRTDPVTGHRPSVDVMFNSLVSLKELKRHIVLMTGMGSDGAKGMLALRESGAETTIAEAEETCVVYGMPRSAVVMQAAKFVLPQHKIPVQIIQAVQTDL